MQFSWTATESDPIIIYHFLLNSIFKTTAEQTGVYKENYDIVIDNDFVKARVFQFSVEIF